MSRKAFSEAQLRKTLRGLKETAVPRWVAPTLILAIILLSLVAISKSRRGVDASTAVPVSRNVASVKVTAQDLLSAYLADPTGAQQRYGQYPLEVSGVVSSVALDNTASRTIMLKTAHEFLEVQAFINPVSQAEVGRLKQGQSVVLTCGGINVAVDQPLLSDCELR